MPINEVYSGHFLKSLIWCTTQFPLKIEGERRCSWRVLIPAQSLTPVVLLLNENTIKIRVVYRFVQTNHGTPLYSTFPKLFFSETAVFVEYHLCYWLANRNCCAFFNKIFPFHIYLFLVCLPNILIRVSTHFRHSISLKQTPYVMDFDITKKKKSVWWKSTFCLSKYA